MLGIIEISKRNVRHKNPKHLGISFIKGEHQMIYLYNYIKDVVKEMIYLKDKDFDMCILKCLESSHKRKRDGLESDSQEISLISYIRKRIIRGMITFFKHIVGKFLLQDT